jgi:hypothetical protein
MILNNNKYVVQTNTTKFSDFKTMTSLIDMVRDLPTGVIGNVLTFIPRNDTAQLMVEAAAQDKLNLKYVRKFQIENKVYLEELYNNIAPSIVGSNVYGDDDAPMQIIRKKISMGEKIRMRAISQREWANKRDM